MSILDYKGYKAEIDYSQEDKVIFGKILFIESSITFHAESASEIEHKFHAAVDSYLAHCKKHNIEPNKSYSGTFNIRTKPEIHKAAAQAAHIKGQTLNEFCSEAIAMAVSVNQPTTPFLRALIDNVQYGAVANNSFAPIGTVSQESNIAQFGIAGNAFNVLNPEELFAH